MRMVSSLELKVGALIIAGILAIVGMIIVSDRLHFDRFYDVSAYVADASGLRTNSPVTLAGLRIGTVEALTSVSDTRGAIKVTLRINERYPLPSNAQLTVGSSGIFGDSYLAFTTTGPSDGQSMPMDGSAEVVAKKGFLENASTQAERLLTAANEFLSPDMHTEMKRLISNAADLAISGNALAKHLDSHEQEFAHTVAAVHSLVEELRTQSAALSKQAEHGIKAYTKLADTALHQTNALAPQITNCLEHLDALTSQSRASLTASTADLHTVLTSIAELSTRFNRLAAAIESGQGVVGKLLLDTNLAKDVDSMSVDLSRTAAYLADHPEAAVFGIDKKDKDLERAQREHEKTRRMLLPPLSGIRLDEHLPSEKH